MAASPGPAVPGSPLLALAANDGWSVVNHRSGLIAALIAAGYRVAVLAPDGPHAQAIRAMGATFVAIAMERRGTSPMADLRTLWAYARAFRRLRPAALLAFTIKPNIYGSLAAWPFKISVINNITGLGEMFASRGPLNRMVVGLYRLALHRSRTIFFQNREDRDLFVEGGLATARQARLLPGSGIDLERFQPRAGAKANTAVGPVRFLFASRLLWDKGVAEYVEAARQLRAQGTNARFELLGLLEPAGTNAVPAATVEQWADCENNVEYLGAASDVRDAIAAADCVVLPSFYREGVPKILLEASAMARPVITTDWVGCRDAVDRGVSGLLVEPRSVESLILAMAEFIALRPSARKAMGQAAREKMVRQFDEKIVHRAYLEALLGSPAPSK